MKFNKDLASIHGYLCADGYVVKNPKTQKHKYYRVGLRNTDLTLLKDFQKKTQKLFDCNSRIYRNERCDISSKEVYNFLTKDGTTYYSHHWRLPTLTKKQLAGWLRSYFDSDGWAHCRVAKDRHIGLDSVNKEGLYQIKDALEKFMISSKIKKHRTLYRLHIFGKENLIKFQKEIGFLHPAKIRTLKKTINSYVDYNWNFPKNATKRNEFVIALIKSKKPNSKRIRFFSIRIENLNMLSEILLNSFKIESKVYGPLKNGRGNLFFALTIHKKNSLHKIESL